MMRRVPFRELIQMNRLQTLRMTIYTSLSQRRSFASQSDRTSSFATAASGAFGIDTIRRHGPRIIALCRYTAINIGGSSHLLLQ